MVKSTAPSGGLQGQQPLKISRGKAIEVLTSTVHFMDDVSLQTALNVSLHPRGLRAVLNQGHEDDDKL